MDRKLISGALFLTLLGSLMLLPPLASVFQVQRRFFGVPSELIYLFSCWIALIVTALSGAGLNCLASSEIDGQAITARISTGTTVQMISISVLWLVFEGIGLRARRKRTIAYASRT